MFEVCQSTLFYQREGGSCDYIAKFLRQLPESDLASFASDVSLASFSSMPVIKQTPSDAVSLNDFYLRLRKRISQFRRMKPSIPFGKENVESAKSAGRFLRTFLQHLVQRVRHIQKSGSASSLQDFQAVLQCWKFVKGLLVQFGILLDEASPGALSLVNHTRSESLQISLHIHLELFALAFTFASEVEVLFPQFVPELCNSMVWNDVTLSESASLKGHVVKFVMENLIRFAAVEYGRMQKHSYTQYLTCRPFPCSCFVDLFCSLQFIREQPTSGPMSMISFILNQALQITQRISTSKSEEFCRSDIVVIATSRLLTSDVPDFMLWFTTHLVAYIGDVHGGLDLMSKNFPLEKQLATRVLLPVMTELDANWVEIRSRYVVACLIRMQTISGPQTESLVILLDFFFRHMNDSFSLQSASVEELQMIQETPLQWVAKWALTDLNRLDNPRILQSTDTSFDLFLRCLVSTFGYGPDVWKRVKGRLLSKLHSRFFASLSPAGWSRVFDMALVLTGRTGDQTDFSHYFCEAALDTALSTTASINKTRVIWRGFLAVIAMCHQQNRDCIGLARKLAGEFDTFCRLCKSTRQDLSVCSMLWGVALVYLESVESFLTADPNSLSLIATLLTSGISDLFYAFADDSKIGKLTALMDDLLSLYLQKFPDWQDQLIQRNGAQHVMFLTSFFANAFPSIKRLALQRGISCLDNVSSLAFKCIAIICGLDGTTVDHTTEPPAALFHYFVISDDVAPAVSASCLLQIIQNPAILSHFQKDDSMEGLMVHSWVRCAIELGDSHDDVRTLSREIIKLNEVSNLMSSRRISNSFTDFVEMCGSAFTDQLPYSERMALQRKCQVYFSDIHKFVGNVIRLATCADQVDCAIGLVGLIVRHCSPVLYIQARLNSILRQVMDVVLFGGENAMITHSLAIHLPHYCFALCRLNFESDPQIRDLFSGLIRNFLLKFGTPSLEQHPLLIGLRTCIDRYPRTCNFSIAVIANSFITHIPVAYNAAIALTFLLRLINSVPAHIYGQSLDTLFSCGLEVCLRGNERMRNDASQLISQCISLHRTNPTEKNRNSLASIVREKSLAAMQSQPVNLFQMLNSLVDQCPVLLREIMPFLAQVCSGKVPSYPMYQNAKARENFVSLQRKFDSAVFL